MIRPDPRFARPGTCRSGFILFVVLLILMAASGLATTGLALALAEDRVSRAVFRRAVGELLAEGEIATSLHRGMPLPEGVAMGPGSTGPAGSPWISGGPARSWREGASTISLSWLSGELALVRGEGRWWDLEPGFHAGVVAWRLDLAEWSGRTGGAAMVSGGRVVMGAPIESAPDTCAASVALRPAVGSAPDRWTMPLDLAGGWKGDAAPSGLELGRIRAAGIPGLVVADSGTVRIAGDTLGPAVFVVPGDVAVGPGGSIRGVVYAGGDFTVEPGGEVLGAVRVRGGLELLPGSAVVADPCEVQQAWVATGLVSTLRPLHPLRWILPL